MIVSNLACMLFVLSAQGSMSVEEAVAPALQAAKLSASTARFDPSLLRLFRSSEFTTPLFEAASLNPWEAPFLFNVFTDGLDSRVGIPNELLNAAMPYVGTGSRRTLLGDPIARFRVDKLSNEQISARLQSLLIERNFDMEGSLESVPLPAQRGALTILLTMESVAEQHHLFLGAISSDTGDGRSAQTIVEESLTGDVSSTAFSKALKIFQETDTKYLVAGANDLALAAQDAAMITAKIPPTEKYNLKIKTPLGQVVLSGASNDTYTESGFDYLLIIDTGGNDTYLNAPSATESHWASVVIDTNGSDKYLSDPALATQDIAGYAQRKGQGIRPGPCGAFMGYSILFDLRGDDLYRSARNGIASGRLGVALLEDCEGNDTYDAYSDSIGFGMFGAGILEDLSGDDTYDGFSQVQGVGLTGGFGGLVDRGGNDRYTANDTVIDFPAAQKTGTPHNSAMSLGAGNGFRRDYLDAHQLAGGIGVLLDDAGDDSYSGGVFVEGCGYLEGVGILRDKSGTDTYNAVWYSQGASAHFAIGFLQDDEGDDHYTAKMKMSQGGGHDFGESFLIDLSGNDNYAGANTTLGAANSNSIGVFIDAAGDDTYSCSDLSLGQVGLDLASRNDDNQPKGLRAQALCLGLFCDLGGNDKYLTSFTWAKNKRTKVNWTAKQFKPEASQVGVFYDR